MLGYVLDEVFVQHRAPAGHPERGARFEAAAQALRKAGLQRRGRHVAIRAATEEELVRVHSASHLDELVRTVPGKSGWIDPDTYFSIGTWEAALAAAGGLAELTTQTLHGELARGLAVVRPPGHHATRDRAMGFCLINNVAVAAAAARAHGATRIAIVDWDPGHLLGGSRGPVPFCSSIPVLPGHRCAYRHRRRRCTGCDDQCRPSRGDG
jgi:acetoin utilization deacetylase AcuC-like enzyme